MALLKLLLIEEDPTQSERISRALAVDGIVAFAVASLEDAVEALGINQFEVVLVGSLRQTREPGNVLYPVVRRLPAPPLVFIYGDETRGACDGAIPLSTEPAQLAHAISSIRLSASSNSDQSASQLASIDVPAFRDQMGNDTELMNEIVSLFFQESAGQLSDLRKELSAHEHRRVSRIAHSLKGSLGSLHATRARYWAQALESASTAEDPVRSAFCLQALEQAIATLKLELEAFVLK